MHSCTASTAAAPSARRPLRPSLAAASRRTSPPSGRPAARRRLHRHAARPARRVRARRAGGRQACAVREAAGAHTRAGEAADRAGPCARRLLDGGAVDALPARLRRDGRLAARGPTRHAARHAVQLQLPWRPGRAGDPAVEPTTRRRCAAGHRHLQPRRHPLGAGTEPTANARPSKICTRSRLAPTGVDAGSA